MYRRRSNYRAAIPAILLWISTGAWADEYASAQAKIQQIESDQLPRGSRIVFSAAELNAYVLHEVPTVTAGVRQPRLELLGQGVARGSALVDFAKLRTAEGHPPGWLLSMLLEGEHPVSVTARISSSAGQATVHVQQVEIGGISVSGGTLDFLIQHFLLPLYPDAVVDRPFALAHRIDRVDVETGRAIVVIGR
ncbi:MAG TPA: hypothetical protein VH640_06920 [Bryobacteraceae bacterium]